MYRYIFHRLDCSAQITRCFEGGRTQLKYFEIIDNFFGEFCQQVNRFIFVQSKL
jgi:hypothetical protein